MGSVTAIVGYTFKADTYCPDCIITQVIGQDFPSTQGLAETDLDNLAKFRKIDRYNENTFDSDTFPKVVFGFQAENDEVCGNCHSKIKETA